MPEYTAIVRVALPAPTPQAAYEQLVEWYARIPKPLEPYTEQLLEDTADESREVPREEFLSEALEELDGACYAVFHGRGGYDREQRNAAKVFTVGRQYKIVSGQVGRFHTSLQFEGIEGNWNDALFTYDKQRAPLTDMYVLPPAREEEDHA